MAKIYLKRDKDFIVLCDEEGNIFENQFVSDVHISVNPSSMPRVEITFLLPKGEKHMATKFVKIEDL